jgi:hypothetical protein
MEEPTRDVERVAGLQLCIDLRRARILEASGAFLVSERSVERAVPYLPMLDAGHLQHEHVVRVVMDVEALRDRRSQINVHLHRVRQLDLELAAEVRQRRPKAVDRLQHDRGAVREQLVDASGVDDVVQLARLDARLLRIERRRQRLPLLHHTERREAKPALRQK